MNSSDDNARTTPATSKGQGGLATPPFREHRRLGSVILGERRGEATQRLAAEMAQTWYRASMKDDGGKEICPRALELIDLAAQELRDGHREAAWALALAAQRELIPVANKPECTALAVSVREQVGKMQGWRRRAVERLVPADGPGPTAAELVEAFQHIDAYNSNQARAQRVLRGELSVLAVVLLATVGALGVLLVAWLPAPQPAPAAAVSSSSLAGLATERLAVLAVLFGVVGACISSVQRATSRSRRSVPKLREAMWASVTRPLIGAAAGLVVWALGVEGILGDQSLGFLGLAFAAGFSERVILRLVPVPDAAEEQEKTGEPDSRQEARKPTVGEPSNAITFRANVGLAVLDTTGRVLLLRRADHPDAWQLPQGGIEPGETPTAAAWRELAEETGLSAAHVQLGNVMGHWLAYELPDRMRSAKTGRGQVQLWHVFRLTDPDAKVKPGREFVEARWADWDDAIAGAVEFRQPVYSQVRDFVNRSQR
jgi:putative (di)nucleoside polyphosphate hydrolase